MLVDELLGRKFGKLTALKKHSKNQILCQCDCGNKKTVRIYDLNNGNSKSCGCSRKEYNKPTDLKGLRIGRLTVLEFDKTVNSNKGKNNINYWLCECECGVVKSVNHKTLIRKHPVRSCGCLQKELLAKRSENPNAGFNKVYRNYIGRCKNKNLTMEITTDEFYELTQKKCFYCKSEPSKISKAWSDNIEPFIYNGIDRLDSSVGYTTDNCVTCCAICNYAKGEMSVDDFKTWVDKIHKNFVIGD